MRRWLGTAALVALACGDPHALAPPEIRYGLEECGFCRMIVSEERYASAVVDEAGTASPFDDVGCLLNHLTERPAAPKRVWVHDHAGGGWIAAEQAWFVRDPQGATPMGSGRVAFASRDAAAAFARDLGVDVVGWTALLEPRAEE